MANVLEIKRKELELMRVETARHEQEFRIEERLDEIERIKEHIKTQKIKEEELKQEIKKLKG